MELKKIKCKICNSLSEGVILNHYNMKICLSCFPSFFERRVEQTIEKYKMFDRETAVLIGISGGKDSMSLAKALKNLNYPVRALHINMEFGELSERTELVVRNFCTKESIPLKVIKLSELFELSLEQISKITKRPICSLCGMIRRYLMNRESESETVVTGHTLNDEVAFILKNMLFWNDDLLSRINPVLKERDGMSRKVKPLCLITEDETRTYCRVLGIEHITEECPHKSEVYSVFKDIVARLNREFPGSIIGFYKGYIKRIRNFYRDSEEENLINRCSRCGYLTTSEVCSVCRLREKLIKYKDGRGS